MMASCDMAFRVVRSCQSEAEDFVDESSAEEDEPKEDDSLEDEDEDDEDEEDPGFESPFLAPDDLSPDVAFSLSEDAAFLYSSLRESVT